MYRRAFLQSTAAFTLTPALAQAYAAEPFSPALWRSLREGSGVVVLNYRASWSITCDLKADILAELMAQNPDYAALSFVEVDWDTFGPAQLTERLKVERNSTLLVLKGGREVARLVAEPYERSIRALLDKALAAA